MNRFELVRATSLDGARERLAEAAGSRFKAGGIDLLDHLKEHLDEPPRLVDLKSIPGLDRIDPEPAGGVTLGPLVTLARVAADDGLRRTHAALARACARAASPQVRNVATLGGNVLQRPRCWYYRLESFRCLKKGGDTCFALRGENRYHAIFGGGPVFAVHASNAAVALLALGATFLVEGEKGPREVPAADFFVRPDEDPTRENRLEAGEILAGIRLPPAPAARSTYDDVREKAGFDWPLVSTAVSLDLAGGVVRGARIVLGAVAPVPWRVPAAEAALVGRRLDESAARAAADAATAGAEPLSDNAYKVELVRVLLRRTLLALA